MQRRLWAGARGYTLPPLRGSIRMRFDIRILGKAPLTQYVAHSFMAYLTPPWRFATFVDQRIGPSVWSNIVIHWSRRRRFLSRPPGGHVADRFSGKVEYQEPKNLAE